MATLSASFFVEAPSAASQAVRRRRASSAEPLQTQLSKDALHARAAALRSDVSPHGNAPLPLAAVGEDTDFLATPTGFGSLAITNRDNCAVVALRAKATAIELQNLKTMPVHVSPFALPSAQFAAEGAAARWPVQPPESAGTASPRIFRQDLGESSSVPLVMRSPVFATPAAAQVLVADFASTAAAEAEEAALATAAAAAAAAARRAQKNKLSSKRRPRAPPPVLSPLTRKALPLPRTTSLECAGSYTARRSSSSVRGTSRRSSQPLVAQAVVPQVRDSVPPQLPPTLLPPAAATSLPSPRRAAKRSNAAEPIVSPTSADRQCGQAAGQKAAVPLSRPQEQRAPHHMSSPWQSVGAAVSAPAKQHEEWRAAHHASHPTAGPVLSHHTDSSLSWMAACPSSMGPAAGPQQMQMQHHLPVHSQHQQAPLPQQQLWSILANASMQPTDQSVRNRPDFPFCALPHHRCNQLAPFGYCFGAASVQQQRQVNTSHAQGHADSLANVLSSWGPSEMPHISLAPFHMLLQPSHNSSSAPRHCASSWPLDKQSEHGDGH